MHPENDEEPLLVEAERLYGKMLENITNKVVISLSNDKSSVSSFPQKQPCEQNKNDAQVSATYS
jgi:hypothetical protein